MKVLGWIVAVFILVTGAVVLVAPHLVMSVAAPLITVPGLYFAAAIRIAVGLVLLAAAAESRMPRTLRVLGGFVVLAGVATPFLGPDRARAIMDWWSAHGEDSMRFFGLIGMAVGALIAYALSGHHRHA